MRITAFAAAVAAPALSASVNAIEGEASYTDGNLSGGTCSFSNYTFPPGLHASGVGPSNWAGGGKCGTCLQVQGPKGSVKVMIVDSCPSCVSNRLNLFIDAFKQIADTKDGIVRVSYEPVGCGINKPLTVRNKIGTSRWFFSMQVLDCNYPITSLDVSNNGGASWQPTVRRDYNYFEREGSTGFDKDFVHVRISCSNGRQVIIPNVSVASESKTVAPVNC